MADERRPKAVSPPRRRTGSVSSSGSSNQEDVSASAWRAVDAALADTSFVDLGWIQPPPADTKDRRLAADALRFIARLVRILRPSHILEFGSGTSTFLLAKACSSLGISPQITSIDHDPEHSVRPSDVGPYPSFTLLQSPLVARKFGGTYLPAYLIPSEVLQTFPPADLVLIDGPSRCLGGREGVLYQAMDFARCGTIVLLDDAHRPDELRAIKHWSARLGDRIETRQLSGFARGLAAMVIRQPARKSDLPAARTIRQERADGNLAREQRQYEILVDRVRRLVSEILPPGSGVTIVSKGDSALLMLREMAAMHFPLNADGAYAGYNPADDPEAIRCLDEARHRGAQFLVFPRTAFWWLDHYRGLLIHLDTHGQRVWGDENCIIYRLEAASGARA